MNKEVSGRTHKRHRNKKLHKRRIAPRQPSFRSEDPFSSTLMRESVGASGKAGAQTSRRMHPGGRGQENKRHGANGESASHIRTPASLRRSSRLKNAGIYTTAFFALMLAGSSPAQAAPETQLYGTSRIAAETNSLKPSRLPRSRCMFRGEGDFEKRLSFAAEGTHRYAKGNGKYVIPQKAEGKGAPPVPTSLVVSVDRARQTITVSVLKYPSGGPKEGVPMPNPFSVDYSGLGLEGARVEVDEFGGMVNLGFFDEKARRETRFAIYPDGPTLGNTRLEEYQELTEAFVGRVLDSLRRLPDFGTENPRLKGLFARARMVVKGKLAPLSGLRARGMDEDGFDELFNRHTNIAYDGAFKAAWKLFVDEAVRVRGKKERREILDGGLRLLQAVVLRPHLAENPRYLKVLDAAIEEGLSEESFAQVLGTISEGEMKYFRVCDIFRKSVEPQLKMLLGRR